MTSMPTLVLEQKSIDSCGLYRSYNSSKNSKLTCDCHMTRRDNLYESDSAMMSVYLSLHLGYKIICLEDLEDDTGQPYLELAVRY
jgi:hypothetical protein